MIPGNEKGSTEKKSLPRKGIVFDIQRFALHDGPGIRTVVFLKGCPLRCEWCCNPESQNFQPELGVFEDRCQACGACVSACTQNAHELVGHNHRFVKSRCTRMGECLEACPSSALKMYGKETDSVQIIEEILKDAAYYKSSGGGLTLSGGEPLAQFEFVEEVLKRAKYFDLFTCIETSGYVDSGRIQRILSSVDLWLYDFKCADDTVHQRTTGVSNRLILENLKILNAHRADVILRCPIIPEINDTELHFRAIASMSQNYTCIKQVEIMPFHNHGRGKAAAIGVFTPNRQQSATEADVCSWLDRLRDLGCQNVIKG